MLTRLYIDNYRCFSNLELELGSLQLLLGGNGTGKSSLLDVVLALRKAVASGALTPASTLTRWDTRTRQTFELDACDPSTKGSYRYRLELDFPQRSGPAQVERESLTLDGVPLFRREGSSAELYGASGSQPQRVLTQPSGASLPMVPLELSPELDRFQGLMHHVIVLRPWPGAIRPAATKDDSELLELSAANFVSWYRAIDPQLHFDARKSLHQDLQDTLEGFESLRFIKTGEQEERLSTVWAAPGSTDPSSAQFELSLGELSDGQRMLIVLYTLLSLSAPRNAPPMTLLLDEPTNYVSLPEIEPWLRQVEERTDEARLQAIVASHHPELLNAWARKAGIRCWRQGSGPVRTERFHVRDDDPLTPAERIARGWDDDDA